MIATATALRTSDAVCVFVVVYHPHGDRHVHTPIEEIFGRVIRPMLAVVLASFRADYLEKSELAGGADAVGFVRPLAAMFGEQRSDHVLGLDARFA